MYRISDESVRTLMEANNLLNQLEVKGSQNAYILYNCFGMIQNVLNSAEEEKGEVISNGIKPIPKKKEETP